MLPPDALAAIRHDHRIAESEMVARLLPWQPAGETAARIGARALQLAQRVRATPPGPLSAESFLRTYGLSTREGVALMCVAEALLRIPDPQTADALLRDKFSGVRWDQAASESWAANAAEWALMLSGTLARWHEADAEPVAQLKRLAARLGEPFVRGAVRQAMRILAGQFVIGQTIDEAVRRAAERSQYLHSFDMLGEAARGREDAERYWAAYVRALEAVPAGDGVSVKLSALHPRFEEAQRDRVLAELLPRIAELARRAARRGVGLTIDAEESERLELTLDLFDAASAEAPLGIAVQAYQKRALAVCDWLAGLKREISVRLVKGAYWDSEVKRAQQLGLPDYPLFTRKSATDAAYVACAAKLLAAPATLFPAFATHNCRTVATVIELAGGRPFEFQKLYGMGDALYEALRAERAVACREYAPVGSFTDLLPYLVRRMLENGANTSFVHLIADPRVQLETLVGAPVQALPSPYVTDPRIPPPPDLYGERHNALGVDLSRRDVLASMRARIAADGDVPSAPTIDPAHAVASAHEAFAAWSERPAAERAALLERAADALEARTFEFVSLVVREGRRTYADAVAEVREAVDFCRYYALQGRRLFAFAQALQGPVGERNELRLAGRGVFACIAPWNFPLAIFTGQVAAALAAGNTVVAKPAEQTPRVGWEAIALLHAVGVPREVVHCVVGDGEGVGAALVADARVAGVAFTGAHDTARRIHATLAARPGAIATLIAETGGINAMLVDASALPEQVVDDVVASAFQSAGQRCSAQRILFVEESCAPRVLRLLAGALAELKVGDAREPDTDVGPIIDAAACAAVRAHVEHLRASAKLIGEAQAPAGGDYVAPIAFELALHALPRAEIFGPILHVCRYRRDELGSVLDWIRGTGYGLTLGIQSRIQGFIDAVSRTARVGNIYVNRSMIGAVVGVQPFGGEGLSGTGPKAGGPHYLLRFAAERTLTVNTAAVGGVTELLAKPT